MAFRPPCPPTFDWTSLIFFTLLSPSLLVSGQLSTWKFPPPDVLRLPYLRFSSLPPSTCYPVSLSAPEFLICGALSVTSVPFHTPPPFSALNVTSVPVRTSGLSLLLVHPSVSVSPIRSPPIPPLTCRPAPLSVLMIFSSRFSSSLVLLSYVLLPLSPLCLPVSWCTMFSSDTCILILGCPFAIWRESRAPPLFGYRSYHPSLTRYSAILKLSRPTPPPPPPLPLPPFHS